MIRVEYSQLTNDQKGNLVESFLKMKRDGKYDPYVQLHFDNMSFAHGGPAFLPWHREYLKRFEEDLGAEVPFWDWTFQDEVLKDEFFGGDGDSSQYDIVVSGSFGRNNGNWRLVKGMGQPSSFLKRNIQGSNDAPSLPSQEEIIAAMNETKYDSHPFNGNSRSGFRNTLEGFVDFEETTGRPELHNRVHVYVGGTMATMGSPNDPIFWMHHAFVDKIWADWQTKMEAQDPTNNHYVGRAGQNATDQLVPWDVTVESTFNYKPY